MLEEDDDDEEEEESDESELFFEDMQKMKIIQPRTSIPETKSMTRFFITPAFIKFGQFPAGTAPRRISIPEAVQSRLRPVFPCLNAS